MKSLIDEMYHGRLEPFGEQHINTDRYHKKAQQLLQAEKELITAYPDCKELLDCFIAVSTEVSGITEYYRFLYGFKVGAQLMIEIFSDK